MARSQRKYDHEYKVQAVKLAREIGGAKAAKECEKSMLKIPATIPMVVSECIRHYSLSSQRACTFQVSVPFIESCKRLDSAIALNGSQMVLPRQIKKLVNQMIS